MILDNQLITRHNDQLQASHQKRFNALQSVLTDEGQKLDSVLDQLAAFQIAIPSWALGTGGTRFGRFAGGGEPRSLEEKIEDVGLLHKLNKSSGAISLHIPWDIPSDASNIKALAAQNGLRFDAMNSNTFQDQPDQKLD